MIQGVDVATWQKLCDVTESLVRLAPWQWMDREDIFGIQLPDSDRVGFVSFAGDRESRYRLCNVLLGWHGLKRFLRVIEREEITKRDIVEIPQFSVMYSPRAELDPRECALFDALGRRYHDKNWPRFRSHREGYVPWFLNRDEARQLILFLHQTLGMTLRIEERNDLLLPPRPGMVLVRSRQPDGEWREDWAEIPPDHPLPADLSLQVLQTLREFGQRLQTVQAAFHITGTTVARPGERLQAVYLLNLLNAENGQSLGVEIMQALEGIDRLRMDLPSAMLKILNDFGGYPRVIEVDSDEMADAVRALMGHLPIKLVRREKLSQQEVFSEMVNVFDEQSRMSANEWQED